MKFIKELRYQGWAIAWTVFILILCCIKMPVSEGPGFFFEGFDKMTHLGFFYVLSVLLFYGRINSSRSYSFRNLTILKIIIFTAGVGGAIEFLQYAFFPYRSAEWWDFACDMIGVGMGIFSYILLHKTAYNEKKY